MLICYIKLNDLLQREQLINELSRRGVMAVFHYIPLHSSPAGIKLGRFEGQEQYTTLESERLLRLPLFYSLTDEEQTRVYQEIINALSELKN